MGMFFVEGVVEIFSLGDVHVRMMKTRWRVHFEQKKMEGVYLFTPEKSS